MSKWQEYLGFGWKLVELRPGTKAPRLSGWQKPDYVFNANALSAGLVHEFSGTCVLDVDHVEHAEKWLADYGISLPEISAAREAVRIESGRRGHAKLLYALPTPRRSLNVAEYTTPHPETGKPQKHFGLNFRCIGNQDVLPPSIHPDTGRPYAWSYGSPDGHWVFLPPLPAALDALWAAQLGSAPTAAPDTPKLVAEAESSEIAELLATRDPDCDMLEWVKVGMAIHSATKGQGLYIWDNWSRRGEKYKGIQDLETRWRGFKKEGGVTIGSLRQDKVAAVDEFPTEAETTAPEDRPISIADAAEALVQPRLVWLGAQERFWALPQEPAIPNFDEHLDLPLKADSVNLLFTQFMPTWAGPKGQTMRREPLEFWKSLPNRLVVKNRSFHPGAPRIYTDPLDGDRYLNTFKAQYAEALAPKPHEKEAWEFLVNRIPDAAYRRWLLQFYAYILKHPGVKVAQAPLLYGEPGSGKSTLMKTVPTLLFGNRNVRMMSNDVITSNFTDGLVGTWFLVLDELKTDGKKQDRIHLANKMKAWITEPMLEIHPKGMAPYSIPNRIQITATSNFDDAVHVTNDDRRWAICELPGTFTDKEKAMLYTGFLNTPRAAGVLRWIFDRVDLTGFDPAARSPTTEGRQEMVRASMGGWESYLVELASTGQAPFDRDVFTASAVRDALIGKSPPGINRISSVLKGTAIKPERRLINNTTYYIWRNVEIWRSAPYQAVFKHMETGEMPEGASREVPLAIRQAAGDDGAPDPCDDLLGAI